ncbi:MAG: hypothetical protein NTZ39_04270 [Methanoregula sp.]|nr:hypothetical protein [Methanoregula sp.]
MNTVAPSAAYPSESRCVVTRSHLLHHARKVVVMVDNEILIIGAFLGSGMLAYVIIPGLLVMWDRVLDHMEHSGMEEPKKQ